MAQAQRTGGANDEQSRSAARPAKSFRQSGIKVDVWRNSGQNGDIYNATISNSYEDEAEKWKTPRASV